MAFLNNAPCPPGSSTLSTIVDKEHLGCLRVGDVAGGADDGVQYLVCTFDPTTGAFATSYTLDSGTGAINSGRPTFPCPGGAAGLTTDKELAGCLRVGDVAGGAADGQQYDVCVFNEDGTVNTNYTLDLPGGAINSARPLFPCDTDGPQLLEISGCIKEDLPSFGYWATILRALNDAATLDGTNSIVILLDGLNAIGGTLTAPFTQANVLAALNAGPNGPGFAVVEDQLVFDPNGGGTLATTIQISPADDLANNSIYLENTRQIIITNPVKVIQSVASDLDGTNITVLDQEIFTFPALTTVVLPLPANQFLDLDCTPEAEPQVALREYCQQEQNFVVTLEDLGGLSDIIVTDIDTGMVTSIGQTFTTIVGAAIDPVSNILYGIDFGGSLASYDLLTGANITPPTLITGFPGLNFSATWNPVTNSIYAYDFAGQNLLSIDPATAVATPVAGPFVPGLPFGTAIVVTQDGTVLVGDSATNQIHELDLINNTNAPIFTSTIVTAMEGLAYNPNTGLIYAYSFGGAGAVINVNTGQETLISTFSSTNAAEYWKSPEIPFIRKFACDVDGSEIYPMGDFDLLGRPFTPFGPIGLCGTPDGKLDVQQFCQNPGEFVIAGNSTTTGGPIEFVNINTGERFTSFMNVDVGAMTVDPVTNTLYALTADGANPQRLLVIDLVNQQIIGTVPLTGGPLFDLTNAAWNAATGEVYAYNDVTDELVAINPATGLVTSVAIGFFPPVPGVQGMAIDTNGDVYLAAGTDLVLLNIGGVTTSVAFTSGTLATIDSLTYNPATNLFYAFEDNVQAVAIDIVGATETPFINPTAANGAAYWNAPEIPILRKYICRDNGNMTFIGTYSAIGSPLVPLGDIIACGSGETTAPTIDLEEVCFFDIAGNKVNGFEVIRFDSDGIYTGSTFLINQVEYTAAELVVLSYRGPFNCDYCPCECFVDDTTGDGLNNVIFYRCTDQFGVVTDWEEPEQITPYVLVGLPADAFACSAAPTCAGSYPDGINLGVTTVFTPAPLNNPNSFVTSVTVTAITDGVTISFPSGGSRTLRANQTATWGTDSCCCSPLSVPTITTNATGTADVDWSEALLA